MEDILSSLKHETFPPGNKLATIGVRECPVTRLDAMP